MKIFNVVIIFILLTLTVVALNISNQAINELMLKEEEYILALSLGEKHDEVHVFLFGNMYLINGDELRETFAGVEERASYFSEKSNVLLDRFLLRIK